MKSFFSIRDARDEEYRVIQESDWAPAVEARAFIEALWDRGAPYLDVDLPRKASVQFRCHFWELYLACAFLDNAVPLVRRADRAGRDAGPDLLLESGTGVEAVLARAGTGSDAVPEIATGEARNVPDEKIRLRLLNALDEKRRKLERYVTTGVHKSDTPFVVAINASAVPDARHEHDLPRIVRSLLPFGPLQAHLDLESLEVTRTSYAYQASLTKSSGAGVATDGFLVGSHLAGISAVLYSCTDPLNRPSVLGGDFVLVHNPEARAPVATGGLPSAHEYIVSEGTVHHRPGIIGRDV
jgi:hypothetical protein